MPAHDLNKIARAMVAPGKGILAADESTGTIEKRFKGINVENNEKHRQAYRQLLFTTKGLGDFISGVILFDETIRQKADDGTPFVELLKKNNVIPGIKVDAGAKALAGSPNEKVTEGLDGLRERLQAYYELGARFTKWRAVITIGAGIPTRYCLIANAEALARYAALSQECGLVPIVEPEVLMDGDHTIERCFEVTQETLHIVFNALHEHHVSLEGMLLKPNMVISAKDCKKQAGPEEVAAMTIRCFNRTVPVAVPGIVFLSGGQTSEQATANLNAINASGPHPWALSFSYGRALQDAPLKAWLGKKENVSKAQQAFAHRAKCNGKAAAGTYSAAMERELVGV